MNVGYKYKSTLEDLKFSVLLNVANGQIKLYYYG